MSLFVGNVSKNVSLKDLEEEFMKFGTCKVNHRGSYAFIEYPDEQDAEDAIMTLNSKNMGGLCLNIEWSKRSTRYDPNKSNRPAARLDRSKERCYKCGQPGHISKDCREAPDCFECGGKGHIAKDCTARRHRSPVRRRSPSPKRSPSPPKHRRRSSSERSFSLEHPGLIEAPNIAAPVEVTKEESESNAEEEFEDDLVFPSEVKAQETETDPAPVQEVPQPSQNELVEADGSRFTLVSVADDPDSCSYKCEVCSKAIQRGNIKKHTASKTHKDRLGAK